MEGADTWAPFPGRVLEHTAGQHAQHRHHPQALEQHGLRPHPEGTKGDPPTLAIPVCTEFREVLV